MLKAMYRAKQRLMRFLLLKTVKAKRAKKLLPWFLALIEKFSNSPAKTLAATLTSWLEPIIGMWRFSKSNGITEGFHTKMEMISRRAFGFRNFENFKLVPGPESHRPYKANVYKGYGVFLLSGVHLGGL